MPTASVSTCRSSTSAVRRTSARKPQRSLAAAALEVLWADTTAGALNKLQRRDMPVLLDLSRGAAALRTARDLRIRRARTLMFAVVDMTRPELTNEAVVSGVADVFARPLGPSRVVNALEREGAQDAKGGRGLQPRPASGMICTACRPRCAT